MTASPAPAEYLLRIGDSCLVLAQRLTQWCGVAPELEEEVALGNIALDLLGSARLWLSEAGRRSHPPRSEDDLAFWRDQHEFRNLLLVEQPSANFADSQVRQFLFDTWHLLVLNQLKCSSDVTIASIAAKTSIEARYHLKRSSHWVIRLGDGTDFSHELAQAAIDTSWDYVGDFFHMDTLDRDMVQGGQGCDFSALQEHWLTYTGDVIERATLRIPDRVPFQVGGRQGHHGEHLHVLLEQMQGVARAHPGATW